MKLLLSGLTICLTTMAPAGAAPFQNGSFETFDAPAADAVCTLGVGYCLQYNAGNPGITGWQVGSSSVDLVGPLAWIAADGDYSIDLNGISSGTLSQTFDTLPGTAYRVDFVIGGNFYGSGTTKVGSVQAAGQALRFSFDHSASTPAIMGWMPLLFEFTALQSSTTLEFSSLSFGDAGVALDQVSVSAVPEPQMALLLLAGLAGLAVHARRRSPS